MADSSFDIVSKIDRQEVDNALSRPPGDRPAIRLQGHRAEINWSGEKTIEM